MPSMRRQDADLESLALSTLTAGACRSGLALSLLTALVSFVALVPLDYLWFRLLGMLGS